MVDGSPSLRVRATEQTVPLGRLSHWVGRQCWLIRSIALVGSLEGVSVLMQPDLHLVQEFPLQGPDDSPQPLPEKALTGGHTHV